MAPLASNWSGLKIRAISALVMVIILLIAEIMGGMVFTVLILFAALQMIREWDGLTANDGLMWKAAGLIYVALPCGCFIWLRNHTQGLELTFFILLVVSATDIGAYFSGRFAGGAKLAPSISPNKTWAGLLGGMALAGIIAGLASSFSPFPAHTGNAMLLGIALAVLAQLGDLFESWLKRRVGAKDSSTLIPGHGGLLDRVDGFIPTVPVFAALVYMA